MILATPESRWHLERRFKSLGSGESFGENQDWRSSKLHIQIALTQISDPNSEEYGRHWTAQDVAKAFAPSITHVSQVKDWLYSSGITADRLSSSHGGGYILIELTVEEATKLFNATCSRRNHGKSKETWIDCDHYNIPESLSSFIDYIITVGKSTKDLSSHAQSRMRHRSEESKAQSLQRRNGTASFSDIDCGEYTTPSCLRELYHIPQEISPHPNNSFGIFELAWATWLPDDLDLFFNTFEPQLVGRYPSVQRIDGGYMQTSFNISPFNLEPDLDFEYAISLTNPLPVTNIQVGDKVLGGDINNMLAAFDRYYCGALNSSIDPTFPASRPGGYNQTTDCGTVTPPRVLSISYSYPEASFPPEYLRRQCLEFLKLGLMGVTVVVSSGDTGTQSGPEPGTCIDGTAGAANATGGRFSPQWPSACPWVTSVGGTQRSAKSNLTSAPAVSAEGKEGQVLETAFRVDLGNDRILTSGGGFSNVFPAPAYQRAAISAYEQRESAHLDELRSKGYLDSSSGAGRGFPDVAALAAGYLAAVDGAVRTVHGTSASAPVFASLVALVNGERLRAARPPVGFANPALYGPHGAAAEAFNDVTTGANRGCGADPAFRAAEGWDAVTGLGSPDYERLRRIFMDLP
ncbi:peptidase S8/S53 domain-containing protein [Hypoxylon rubiginosum]|uniref:Peptidase S8/S53 domain-containing protein n=1 Tax=Hypoxylon rubiginosum TaxID=110542 RepID=A0ACB9Z4F7_9PEZI|nr:peptidase S8/S53 domain-containing protein [Hypoxylon rubiginosum]